MARGPEGRDVDAQQDGRVEKANLRGQLFVCSSCFSSTIKLTHMQPNSLHKSPPNSPRSPQYRNI